MALSVIGAGFGRTGTESMKQALEMLGFGPCHHMKEVLADPDQIALWRAAARGVTPDWDEAFAGFRSCVDWPAAFFWHDLARHFPQAKVLLTVRDADSWFTSMENTILRTLKTSTDRDSVGLKLIGERVFGGRYDDRDHIIATYERNTEEVQAAIPSERLLTYQLGSGWRPLCDFLGRPVPDMPYPHSNSGEEFNAFMSGRNGKSSGGAPNAT